MEWERIARVKGVSDYLYICLLVLIVMFFCRLRGRGCMGIHAICLHFIYCLLEGSLR